MYCYVALSDLTSVVEEKCHSLGNVPVSVFP